MKTLVTLFALCITTLAQDYIDGQYFIHVHESMVQSPSQDEAFVNVLRTTFNTDVKRFYNFNPQKLLYVHASAQDIERVRQLKEVKMIEQNSWAYADQDCTPVAQPGTWGLDRVDQDKPLSYTNPTDPSAEYLWGPSDGAGVSVYVFDTGIDIEHSNFEGRASFDYAADDVLNKSPGDVNGHGTHCAGIVASRDYGIAKGATVHAVKVLNDNASGTWSSIIESIDWLTNLEDRQCPLAASMSLIGSGRNTAVQIALEALIASGVPVAVSAGNSNTDACSQTPAFVPSAITVGASTITDSRASFSNYGPCCDIFAPGVDVLSTYPGEGTAVFTGTSMACPHVAGSVARYLEYAPSSTPDDVVKYLRSVATQDTLGDLPAGTDNLLLFCDCIA